MDAVDRKQEVLEAMKGAPLDGGSGVRGKGLKRAKNASDGGDLNTYSSKPVTLKDDRRKHPDASVAEAVANMTFAGMPQDTIAKVLKVSLDTLHRYYKHELETGQAAIVGNIAGSLAQRALSGSDTAAIFLLKTRGKGQFSERTQLELTGKDGGPIEIQMRTETLGKIASLLERSGDIIEGEFEEKKGAHEGAE